MAPSPPIGAQQAVINVFVELFKTVPFIREKINYIYRVPRLRSRLFDLPAIHVFHASRDQANAGKVAGGVPNKTIYDNSSIVMVDVITPMDDPETADRSIHKFEEAVENVIIDNVQAIKFDPEIQAIIPPGMVWQSVRFLGSNYEADEMDELAIDEVLMQFEVKYDRRR